MDDLNFFIQSDGALVAQRNKFNVSAFAQHLSEDAVFLNTMHTLRKRRESGEVQRDRVSFRDQITRAVEASATRFKQVRHPQKYNITELFNALVQERADKLDAERAGAGREFIVFAGQYDQAYTRLRELEAQTAPGVLSTRGDGPDVLRTVTAIVNGAGTAYKNARRRAGPPPRGPRPPITKPKTTARSKTTVGPKTTVRPNVTTARGPNKYWGTNRTQLPPAIERAAAKRIFDRFYSKRPNPERSKKADAGRLARKLVTKAKDYVPDKTDMLGVDTPFHGRRLGGGTLAERRTVMERRGAPYGYTARGRPRLRPVNGHAQKVSRWMGTGLSLAAASARAKAD